jgi:hypothetical protein
VSYAQAYIAEVPLEQAWTQFMSHASRVMSSAPLIWILAAIGLTALCWERRARKRWLFVALFALFSFLAICPGFYFRPHYFVLTLPAAGLLAGLAISAMANLLSRTRKPVVQYGAPITLAQLEHFRG